MNHTPIRICVANKRAFIWDVDDIAKIRSDHHICGILAGTLPHLSQQNVFLGVPLVLMPEEVVLLVENVLVDDPKAYPDPTMPQFQRWLEDEHRKRKQQLEAFGLKNTKDGVLDRSMSEEAVKKRKARTLKRQGIGVF
ncbi:hypothetical protein MPER_05692 [Moniliophthora perniciosa FA553]|nr:hypothetical protein MPER_05692 [Moniliophthora perniciosa FA553]